LDIPAKGDDEEIGGQWPGPKPSLVSTMSRLPRLRFFHSTYLRKNILVGPPDPVSNLRPVLYDGLPDQKKTNAYSSRELRAHPMDPHKFELDLASQRLDKFNQEFWTNVRFTIIQSESNFLFDRVIRDFTSLERFSLILGTRGCNWPEHPRSVSEWNKSISRNSMRYGCN
jgi:hypothetical protein